MAFFLLFSCFLPLSSTFPGAGVFFLSSSEGQRISFLLDCMVSGVSPSRVPHGLRPALPGQRGKARPQSARRLHPTARTCTHKREQVPQPGPFIGDSLKEAFPGALTWKQ